MRFWLVIGALVLVGAGFYWIWSDVNGLVLVQEAKNGYFSAYIPEKESVKLAFKFNTLADNQGIYAYFVIPFALVAVIFFIIGIFGGYLAREPIDEYDFKALEEKTERELEVAREETKKAQEAAKNAQSEAIKQAKADLEHELRRAEYQRSEAEKERRAAIQAQQAAEAAIRKAQIERTDALRIADNATRKKNAAYSAAERFKRKAEKTKA
jgi:preprotein translocase subunit SecG